MQFEIDDDKAAGTSPDGVYRIYMRGEQLGYVFDISVHGRHELSVWARRQWREALPYEIREAKGATSVDEWIIDNGAGQGFDKLITLSNPVGERTLGELVLTFLRCKMKAEGQDGSTMISLLKLSCRGNQRSLMYDIAGR